MPSAVKYIILIFLSFSIHMKTESLFAQFDEKDFIQYTVKEGLTDNVITCITQDELGYLWLGTDIGLNRFDGSSFEKFYQSQPDHFLASSNIRVLKNFGDDQLAILGSEGFQWLNTRTYEMRNYFIPDTTPFKVMRNSAWDVVRLPGDQFGMTTSSGFYVFNQNGTIDFRHDAYGLEDIGKKKIFYGRNIFEVSDRELLLYTNENEITQFVIPTREYRNVSCPDKQWCVFDYPLKSTGQYWLNKFQINRDEFLFIPRYDSLVFYNHRLGLKMVSHVPFNVLEEFSWESKLLVYNDTIALLSSGFDGFFILHLDRKAGIVRVDPHKFLSGHKIRSLFKDRDNRLWIGTSKGLLKQILSPPFIEKFNWPTEDKSNDGYKDCFIHKGRLYLARFSGDVGLVIVDLATMRIINQIRFFDQDRESNQILTIQQYYADTLWLGTLSNIIWFDTKTYRYGKITNPEFQKHNAFSFPILGAATNDGYAWMTGYLTSEAARYHIASRTFKVFSPNTTPALPFNTPKSVVHDAYGDVWIGGHSLARWNNKQRVFDTLITVYGGPNRFNEDILALRADDSGSLWMHNANNGLLQYIIKERKWVHYGMKEGLPSDVIRCISMVIDHTLWMASHNHLTRFDTRSARVEIYDFTDGLPDQMPLSRSMYFDTLERKLYAFYKDEVIRFSVDHHPETTSDVDFLLQKVVINSQRSIYHPHEELKLSSEENSLAIQFAVLDFDAGPQYQFAYKINPTDSWTSIGNNRTLNLTNLSPGGYTLQLRATGKSGAQNVKSLSFSIAPPFYWTGWFLTLSAFLIMGLFYVLYRWRMIRFRQMENIDRLLSQTEMKALHAQMNPHFIFNSLNSIREMILHHENAEASRYLSKFAYLIRLTLDQSRQSNISLRGTIDYLNRYIEMEKIRNSHFDFSISTDPELDLDETVFPPMFIQPFIENAIWHGSNGDVQQIRIYVAFEKNGSQLVCVIDDDGVGIQHTLERKTGADLKHDSVGISNIKNRIGLLNKKYDVPSSIAIIDKSREGGCTSTGTRVTITLPLEMTEV